MADIKKMTKGKGPAPSQREGERIAKVMARAGVASRREVERMIAAGRVSVNGRVIASPALNVGLDALIALDGILVGAAEGTRVWRYHKTAGTLTTNRDPKGRATVFEKLPPDMPRTVSVGRLDFNTEGLLLLTNDGELARHLELPKNAWLRHYRVRAHGMPDLKKVQELQDGATIEGVRYEPMKIEMEDKKATGANQWLSITIREGKNREVRKAMDYCGVQVTRLIRVSFGPFQLGKLPRGAVEEVPARILRDALGAFWKSRKKP